MIGGGVMQVSMPLGLGGERRRIADRVAGLERAGLDMVWVPEAFSFDSPSLMGYLAAKTETLQIASGILPLYSRTPTLIAMTAAGLDDLSGGRFQLGLGVSGPQVVEGWHGVPYHSPLGRTREVVDICREVWLRERPLEYQGRYYQLPLPPEEGTGLGKPIKMIDHPQRSRVPVWLAALGERNVELAAEIAEGWIPFLFIPEMAADVWGASLRAGKAKRQEGLGPLQISAGGLVAIGESEEVLAVRERARPGVALYIGGMGAKGRNFYNDVACRYGFEKEAAEIQDLYLAGKKAEAEALVPGELLELTSLAGPKSWVAERIAAHREAGVTNLQVNLAPTGGQSEAELLDELRQLLG